MATCNQANCNNPGAFRFTWPGSDEAEICEEHLSMLLAVADAIGLHLEVRPMRFLAGFMAEGEAERLECAVIDAALTWTALMRHGEVGKKVTEAATSLYEACRQLHIARERAFARKISKCL